MNLPNKLTILRICIIPVFVAVYFLPFTFSAYIATGLFILAAITDFLDGFIARKYNLVTDLGKLLDPIADKVLVAAALFCVVASNPVQYLDGLLASAGWWLTFGRIFLPVCASLIIARELLIDAVRMIAASKGQVVQANIFGKIKTVMQDISLPLLVVMNAFGVFAAVNIAHPVAFCIGLIAILTFSVATIMTVISGIIYLVQNKHVFTTQSEDGQGEKC